jgi:heavy metal translocating P-type ATPase
MRLLRHYWIPVFALCGLVLGLALRFAFGQVMAAEWIWFAILVLGGAPIVWKTLKGVLKWQFASDLVAMLAIVAAVLLREAFAGAVVVLMQSGGEAIEAYGLRRASSSLTALLERAPRRARRKRDGQLEEIDVGEVQVGDILIVRPGDLVPVDGRIVEGAAQIDESALTGEPFARSRGVGDPLLSGSVDLDGAIQMRAERVSQESQYAKIVALVRRAQEEKAPIQRLADRYAIWFTPLTLLMAAIGYLITWNPTTVLAVLVVATPCPLILATPLAVICSLNRATDAGIIIKGGAPLEQVASTRAALFDKTGTITYGEPVVEQLVSLEGESAESFLYHVACIEQLSSHTLAKAVVVQAQKQFEKLELPQQFQETAGKGVEGLIDGQRYLIGSRGLMVERGIAVDGRPGPNQMFVYVARNQSLIGHLVLSDQIRPEAPALMQRLRALHVQKLVMLTGDSRTNAEAVAEQAGIDQVEAELLPEQKVQLVQQFKASYAPVIMVGDGINDAPALATATVGIAMGGHGTAISAEAADIVLLADDLSKVASAIEIGKRMLRIAKQSIWVGIGLSFCLMVMAAWGLIPPPVGAILQEFIDVAVILNALRVR